MYVVYFGNLGPLMMMWEMRDPWSVDDANDKRDLLITWWEINGHIGALWWRNDKLGFFDNPIGFWSHHFDDMLRKLGALDRAMENLGPFVKFALKKAMEKLGLG